MEMRFHIKENKLDDLKLFIRTELPSARFLSNPLKMQTENWYEYYIAISLDVNDGNKLSASEFRI